MIEYQCTKCDNLLCETSICPICKQKAEVKKSTIFYCNKCNVPSFEKECALCHSDCEEIGSDLRPVFPIERLLLEVLLDDQIDLLQKSVWNTSGHKYIVDGKKVNVSFKNLSNKYSSEYVINKLNQKIEQNRSYIDKFLLTDSINKFIESNKSRLNTIVYEATKYIQDIVAEKKINDMFVSFSGGKDSTVVSHLVMDALNNKRIIHIYGDTTLEYPTSLNYVSRFKKENPETPLLIAKNRDQDFNNLCEVIGPPSRMMRWCCTIFKTGAITKKIDATFRNSIKVLAFQGIRRSESLSRSKYERESNESKIIKQIAINPIIDWLDFDVWLYILANKIDFNEAYQLGFSRVGCWCCPNNSSWSEFLSSIYMANEYKTFRTILYNFAQKIGKADFKEYIDDGERKKRQGGNGLSISKKSIVTFKPCALEENSLNFDLTRPIDKNLYTFFIPFGILDFNIGNKLINEVYVLDKHTKNPILKLSGRIGNTMLKITILDNSKFFKNKKITEMFLKNQINKFQTCIGCTYCQAVCKYGALKVFNTEKGNVSNETIYYEIDKDKCVGCLECVKHFDNGCYINKVLKTKKGSL